MRGFMNNQIKSKKNVEKLDEIEIDRSILTEPLDSNFGSFIKVHHFLKLLSKTDDSFTWIENETKNVVAKMEVDKDGLIITDTNKVAEYELKMKPIHDCEKFINENSFDFWDLISLITIAKRDAISASAQKKAFTKLANDPKQKALAKIEQHYEANKTQFKRRGFSARFIREMHSKYPIIESQKTIENLVSALNKENDAIPR
jgi:hypothetical protein